MYINYLKLFCFALTNVKALPVSILKRQKACHVFINTEGPSSTMSWPNMTGSTSRSSDSADHWWKHPIRELLSPVSPLVRSLEISHRNSRASRVGQYLKSGFGDHQEIFQDQSNRGYYAIVLQHLSLNTIACQYLILDAHCILYLISTCPINVKPHSLCKADFPCLPLKPMLHIYYITWWRIWVSTWEWTGSENLQDSTAYTSSRTATPGLHKEFVVGLTQICTGIVRFPFILVISSARIPWCRLS